MKRSFMIIVACGVTAAALPFDAARAATNAAGGSYCLYSLQSGSDCGFTSLAQCQASASGTDARCSGAPPQAREPGAAAPQAAPAQARRGTGRVGGR